MHTNVLVPLNGSTRRKSGHVELEQVCSIMHNVMALEMEFESGVSLGIPKMENTTQKIW